MSYLTNQLFNRKNNMSAL